MVHHLTVKKGTDYICQNPTTFKNLNGSISSTIIEEIGNIHNQLCQTEQLEPSEHVNALFTKLVTICTIPYDDNTVANVLCDLRTSALVPSLRLLASQGEYLLELKWATDLVNQVKDYHDNKPKLSRFIYYQNYEDLVKLELHALQGAGANLQNIVFIGSGPLPLSPILMYQSFPNSKMHNIDRDLESIEISNKLLEKLGIAHGFEQHVMDAISYPHFDQANVVVLGALVGQDAEEKMLFMKTIGNSMQSGSFLMVRSAHSLRKLLYPSIESYQVNACGFQTILVLHPHNDVVNSILIAKKL